MSIFSLLERFIEDDIPKPVKFILTSLGYDSKLALKKITSDSVLQIEKYINEHYEELIGGLVGSHYENVRPFQLLPGHRALIESLPQYIDQININNQSIVSQCPADFSTMLKLLIENAERNSGRETKGRRHIQLLTHFATFVYLNCGRACYETLAANFPLPSVNTICTYVITSFS